MVSPGLRTPGEIAAHIVYGRAKWLHHVPGEGATELTPLLRWDDADEPPHTAAEIVDGLDLTWRFITAYLMRGSRQFAVVFVELIYKIPDPSKLTTPAS